jgi:hypothetical protein
MQKKEGIYEKTEREELWENRDRSRGLAAKKITFLFSTLLTFSSHMEPS